MTVDVRSYDPDGDEAALWSLKRAFEHELGSKTGDGAKEAKYAAKLDEDYRDRYLAWAGRCHADDPDTIALAVDDGDVIGYVFVLPAELSMIWDAAVLNEIFVDPDHRGSGVADRLMEWAIAVAGSQSLPLDRLVLDVDPDNERAARFYRRYGFESWGELVAIDL